jgi:hypothetical protein
MFDGRDFLIHYFFRYCVVVSFSMRRMPADQVGYSRGKSIRRAIAAPVVGPDEEQGSVDLDIIDYKLTYHIVSLGWP